MSYWSFRALPSLFILLAACGPQPQVQRIELDDVGGTAAFGLTPSPDTADAAWSIEPDGKGIAFGKSPDKSFLSLVCEPGGAAPQITVIREAQSEPGAKALFAVLGNGVIARLKLDAVLAGDDGWRWEGTYPADAPQFDVFTGPRDIQATMPGAGMLEIAGSTLPREFIDWCRSGGKAPESALLSPPTPG